MAQLKIPQELPKKVSLSVFLLIISDAEFSESRTRVIAERNDSIPGRKDLPEAKKIVLVIATRQDHSLPVFGLD